MGFNGTLISLNELFVASTAAAAADRVDEQFDSMGQTSTANFLFLEHWNVPLTFTSRSIFNSCLTLCDPPKTPPPTPHGCKLLVWRKQYTYYFVDKPTQKFKTPLSSREASWNDNPDDSELRNTIIENQLSNGKSMSYLKWYTRSSSAGLPFLHDSIPSSDAKSGTSGLSPPATVEGTTSTDVTHEKWPEPAITASVLTRWQRRRNQHALHQHCCYVRIQPLNFRWEKGQGPYWIPVYSK